MAPGCAGGAPAASSLLRVLCLHGYAQNGEVFRARTGAVRKHLKGMCEFVFIDAPHPATASFLASEAETDGDSRRLGWWNAAADEPEGTRPSTSRNYVGWEESRRQLESTFAEQGPFDGILAFSQGASAAALALATLDEALTSSIRFAVLVAGFYPRDEALRDRLVSAPPIAVRTLHVCGEGDELVPPASTEQLAQHFSRASVLKHPGGHAVPGAAPFRAALRAFVQSVVDLDPQGA